MCNTSLQQNGFNNTVDPLSFSTFHLLRTCNRLMLPNTGENSVKIGILIFLLNFRRRISEGRRDILKFSQLIIEIIF